MTNVDVLVAGAGPAGCATATVLARAGLRVHVADAKRGAHAWAGESLPPGAGSLIASVFGDGILTDPPHRVAFGVRGAWGSADLVDTDFIAHPSGIGWHVDRETFDAQLCDATVSAGASISGGQPITRVERVAHGWRIGVGAATWDARWIVDASGRAGAIVGRLGIPRHRLDQQVAEIAVVGDADEAAVTTIEATGDGWWYSTPLPRGRRVVAFLTDADLEMAATVGGASFDERLAATEQIVRLVNARDRPVTARHYPADLSCRSRLSGAGWSAVGDAAITWDPLSSQGVVTGALMGARLAPAITATLATGSRDALPAWESDYRLLLEEHSDLRAYYAAAEQRWPDSLFWRRRSEVTS